MEIERKFLFEALPPQEPALWIQIEQGYICTDPVIRIRRRHTKAGTDYVLTVKGRGLVEREEWEMALSEEQFEGLRGRCIGKMITKTRYCFPLEEGLMAEADVFEGHMQGLKMVEVEFPDSEACACFVKPGWFGREVSDDVRFHNNNMIFRSGSEELTDGNG